MSAPEMRLRDIRFDSSAIALSASCAVLYAINAIGAILILGMVCCFWRRDPRTPLILLAFFVSIYVALINVTKEPASDLITYLDWFKEAQSRPLLDFLQVQAREYLYFSYLYAIANMPYVGERSFVFLSTALAYLIFLYSLIDLGIRSSFRNVSIVAILIFFALFTPLFNNSAHLMRQFIGGAFIVWFLVARQRDGREHWILLLSSVLLHSTAIGVVMLVFVARMRRFTPLIQTTIAAIVTFGVIVTAKIVSVYLLSVPYIVYIAKRVHEDQYHEHDPLGMGPVVYLLITLCLSLYLLSREVPHSQSITEGGLREIQVTSALLCIFVLVAHLMGETMLAVRFILYVYFLSSLVLLCSMHRVLIRYSVYILAFTVAPITFIWNIENGVWVYGAVEKILMLPLSLIV